MGLGSVYCPSTPQQAAERPTRPPYLQSHHRTHRGFSLLAPRVANSVTCGCSVQTATARAQQLGSFNQPPLPTGTQTPRARDGAGGEPTVLPRAMCAQKCVCGGI